MSRFTTHLNFNTTAWPPAYGTNLAGGGLIGPSSMSVDGAADRRPIHWPAVPDVTLHPLRGMKSAELRSQTFQQP